MLTLSDSQLKWDEWPAKAYQPFTRLPTTPPRIDASVEIDRRAMSPFAAEFLDKITGAEIKVNAHGVSDGYLY